MLNSIIETDFEGAHAPRDSQISQIVVKDE